MYIAPLTPREQLFVCEYLVDLSPGLAYQRSQPGTSVTILAAQQAGYRMLGRVQVQRAINDALAERRARVNIDQDAVLRMWFDIATADPNDLVRSERLCCRHCYGIDHAYQWRDMAEWVEAVDRAMRQADQENEKLRAAGKKQQVLPRIPSNEGGFDFDRKLSPHGKCPKCDGRGELDVFVADSRLLSGPARRLYAGIKQTKNGIEVLMRDQDAAAVNLARHLGMLTDKLVLLQSLPDDQLAAYARSVTTPNAAGDGAAGTGTPAAPGGAAQVDPRDTSPVPRGAQPAGDARAPT